MKKILLATAAALLVASLSHAQTATPPKRELRGVWVSTHLSLDWPVRTQTPEQQRSALAAILDHNKATGMNAFFLQVRSQADAMYPSNLEPWSYYLTNNQGSAPAPYWDPLQYAIDETRKRGLEFHAWINPYRAVANTATQGNTAQYTASHVSRAHPEWMLQVGTVKILNPGLPAVRDHVLAVIMDIVQRYDVDGIHFDDYFYPAGTTGDDAAYNADPRGFPNTTAGRADWRRDNINLLIERVNSSIRAVKPWVKFGVSPSGIYRSSTDPAIGSPTSAGASQHYSAMFADSRKWIQSGWVDYLAPQVYWYIGQTGSDYKLLVPWWNANAYGRHIYVGLADYKMNTVGWTDPAQIANQIALNRDNGNVYGQIHFRHAFLAVNPLNYRTDLKQNIYKRPALLPAMPWKDNLPVPAPGELAALPSQDAVQLAWAAPAPSGDEMEKPRRFAIYRSAQRDMDIEAPANLLGLTTANETTFADTTAGAGQYYYYTVTALNRLHHESARTNTVSNDIEPPVVRTRDVSITLADGSASIGAADIDNGSSDNWGVESMSASRSMFSCTDIGANRVELSVTDKAGLTSSAAATVHVEGRVPQPVIGVSRANGTETGLPANVIALGYGAQALTLAASDAGANSYAWSPAAGLSATSGAVTTFTPSAAGSYSFTLQASSENACVAAASVNIAVIDARCGNDKVKVCHQTGSRSHGGNELCVAPNAVPAFLRKGDALGSCTQ